MGYWKEEGLLQQSQVLWQCFVMFIWWVAGPLRILTSIPSFGTQAQAGTASEKEQPCQSGLWEPWGFGLGDQIIRCNWVPLGKFGESNMESSLWHITGTKDRQLIFLCVCVSLSFREVIFNFFLNWRYAQSTTLIEELHGPHLLTCADSPTLLYLQGDLCVCVCVCVLWLLNLYLRAGGFLLSRSLVRCGSVLAFHQGGKLASSPGILSAPKLVSSLAAWEHGPSSPSSGQQQFLLTPPVYP